METISVSYLWMTYLIKYEWEDMKDIALEKFREYIKKQRKSDTE